MTLTDLPLEVLLDNLLPALPTRDLLNLACTNRFFADLCSDETLWHTKLLVDFNFTGAETARSTGWKFIYKGLDKPQVYVWGDRRDGRLGLSRYPRAETFGVPLPTRLKLPGARIVSLVASGWAFHALDSEGNIYVCGTLNSEGAVVSRSDGFSASSQPAHTPEKLSLPVPFRSISCGRMHTSALDANNKIWNFVSWGRPFRMTPPVFDDCDFAPVQVECGWMFSCVLVKSGDVFAWWPFSGTMEARIDTNTHRMNKDRNTFAKGVNGVVQCAPWDLDMMPERLPRLPPLPELGGAVDVDAMPETKLVKIAGFDGHIVGLTNKGHVVKFRGLDNEQTVAQGQWTYLPKFSEAAALRDHTTFSDPESGLKAPQSLQITHITANFLTFVAYSTGSSSIILMGDTDTTEESEPRIIPALQNKDVISVVLGDYHNAALTSNGKLYTWGNFSNGALGLGESGPFGGRTVDVPTEVRFDHGRKERKDRFCLAVAAGGWHTGALVIDLEPGNDESDEKAVPEPGPASPSPSNRRYGPGQMPFMPFPFRVGFAGRHGRYRPFSDPGSSESDQQDEP